MPSARMLAAAALTGAALSLPTAGGGDAGADIPLAPDQGDGPAVTFYRGPELGFSVDCDGRIVVPLLARGCGFNPYVGVDPSARIPG